MEYSKVLITGGAGFIGSALSKRLALSQNEIYIFDNGFRKGFSEDYENNFNINLIKGDLLKSDDWKKIPKDIDFVFHLGAINGTKYFYEIPDQVLQVNILGTFNMLNWILNSNIKSFFFASSSEVYGFPKKFPTEEIQELSIPDPTNPRFSYSSSKIIGEVLSINFAKKYGIPYRIGRFHNVYGPNMGFEHVIPEFVRKITKSEDFTVQGNGTESRCFCYIDDAVDAIELISKSNEAKNEIFNIGTQEEITINDLISLLGTISKNTIKPIYSDFKNAGTKRRVPDISKIKKIGFTPKIYFKDGLEKSYDWYREWWQNH